MIPYKKCPHSEFFWSGFSLISLIQFSGLLLGSVKLDSHNIMDQLLSNIFLEILTKHEPVNNKMLEQIKTFS